MIEKQQSVGFAKETMAFSCGTGKDARIYIKFVVKEDGINKIYNIPLLTVTAIQVFTSTPKEPRFIIGQADPIGLNDGNKQIAGTINAITSNETIGNRLRKVLKNYRPIEGKNLQLDTNGYITLKELDGLKHLDQLPPCDIVIYLTNPFTKRVHSKMIKGVTFSSESHTIGNSATMNERYSFFGIKTTNIKEEELSFEIE